MNKNTSQLQDRILKTGRKRGRVVVKQYYGTNIKGDEVKRSKWVMDNPPVFTKERDFLRDLITIILNRKRDTGT